MTTNEIFAELRMWEDRFAPEMWRIAVAIRDAAIALNRLGWGDGGVDLPEKFSNDDDGDGVSFRWSRPSQSKGPDFIWVTVHLACGLLHGDEPGYNIVIEADSPDGNFYTFVPDNFTIRAWKTSYGDLLDTVEYLLTSWSYIATGIRDAAARIEVGK